MSSVGDYAGVQKRVRFCLMGHVDCGKSTLLGTLLSTTTTHLAMVCR